MVRGSLKIQINESNLAVPDIKKDNLEVGKSKYLNDKCSSNNTEQINED